MSISSSGRKSIGNMFLKSGIEKILADRDIKRKENLQLKKACENALEELKAEEQEAPNSSSSSNGEHLPDAGSNLEADRYFLPFELACNSKSPRIVITALDCLQKLIAYGHLTGKGADISNPERKLIDRIVEAICAAFVGQGTDEAVLLQLIKAVLAAVLSTHCEVHEASLLLAVRTCFNIFLTSKSPINQATAKGTLTQVINTVFGNMERFGNVKDDQTVVKEVVEMLVVSTVQSEISDERSEGGTTRRGGSTMGESEAVADDQQLNFVNVYQKDAFLVFRALCVLAQKEEGDLNDMRNTHLRSKLLALEMLLLVLQNSSTVLQGSQPFIILIKKSLCVALSRNAVSTNVQVFEKSLAIFVELLDKFKQHLKMQIEVFFKEIILSMLESTTCPFEQKWIVLNTIGKILANPQSVVDMFVNYDCDMTSHNLFKSIVEVVSKTTRTAINDNSTVAQKERERAMRLLGLSCLTDLLQCLVDWFQVCEVAKLSCDIADSETASLEQSKDFEKFENLKQKKDLMEHGILIFAAKPKKGLQILQDHGFVGKTPIEIAEFFMKEERLDKTMIGDYLGDHDEFCKQVMYAYVDDLDLSSLDIVTALRLFLEKFRLPGEAQKIDRLMEKFASRYCDCNPSLGIFASADTAYVLAYSIILLTTDLHSTQVKHKMTKEQYINMNRGINNNGDLPSDLLAAIYDDISKNEIKMKAGAALLLKSAGGPSNSATDKQRRAMATLELEAMSETARALMESASDSDTDFTPAQHQHHVKPMFKICWTPCLAAFSVGVQMSDDDEEWSLCLRGFRLGVRAACVLNATLERNAFIQALARFTLLTAKNSLGEMKMKNIEAIKLLLLIGDEDGEYLEENWVDVMKCMSSLELVQLIGTGLNSGSSDGDSSRQYVLRNTGSLDERTLANLQDALGETSSQSVVVAVDRIFNGSSRLSADAIVHFVKALCGVSREELSQAAAPRMFLLGKMVEVAFYNMNRIRLEWSRIWHVIGEHFNMAGCNTNEAVAYFSVDALRQLSIKFLEKGELPNFRFQKDFLRPFEVIMAKNGSAQTRDLVVRCCTQLVEAHSCRLKSGWQNLFSVWTIAAGDPNMDIVETSFTAASHVIENRFKEDFTSFLDSFQEALKCLQEFACNANLPDMNMEAIRLIRLCAEYVSKNREKIDEAARDDSHVISADQHVWLRGWFPIFFELSCIINRCKLDVRTRSLVVMFEIMKHHGSDFRPEWWRDLLEIVFRIFDHAKMDEHRGDKREWMSTTCNHAMVSVVDVFTQFFDLLSVYALPMIYRQFAIFIRQQNEQLARCTISCLESLIRQNGDKFTDSMWEQTIDLIRELFAATLPKSLLTWEPMRGSNVIGREEQPTSNGSDALFAEQIVFCVVQNELVEAVSRIVLGIKKESNQSENYDGLFVQMSPKLLLSICDALADSQKLAKQFNDNNGQRTLLWKAGLRGSSKPNLINQETKSLSAMLAIVLRLLYDERAYDMKEEIGQRVLDVVSLALSGYGEAASESRRNAYEPVICELLKECIRLPPHMLPLLGEQFPMRLCDLVETAEGQTMRKLLAEMLRSLISINTKRVVNGNG